MPDDIQVCIDKSLPPEKLVESAERAIEENPANAPMVRPRGGFGIPPTSPVRMALITEKRWKNGRTLRVSFLNGRPEIQARVKDYALQWEDHASLKLDFGSDPDAEIRIAFLAGQGSWSYMGTDALTIERSRPTMNFGWLTPFTSDQEYSRVVLHEFGHALGCIHEHQHPEGEIPWDREAVYRYYMGPPNSWSKAQVDQNIFATYSRTMTQFSDFDPASIMLYAIPNALTLGDFEVGWNTMLSQTDKSFIGTMYPFDPKPVTELAVGGSPTEASIGKHGEEDLFRFQVPGEGRYRLETQGGTDIVMALFGPDDQTALIAEDDDSGRNYNARITAELTPGTYYVRIRHYGPTGTGNYTISLREQ